MIELTEYDRDMFVNLDTLLVESGWYDIRQTRKDLDRFVSAIKKRIYHKNDFEFNGDYTRFRRIEVFVYPKDDRITYSIEWKEDTGELNEKELSLEYKPKGLDNKQWSKLKGRV